MFDQNASRIVFAYVYLFIIIELLSDILMLYNIVVLL